MDQRLSLITLGVRDVSRAQAFYEALGWRLGGGVDDDTDHVAFFQAGGLIVALWDRGKLAVDSGVTDTGGWGGVTLAYNVRSPEEVDAVLAEAGAAGGDDRPSRRGHVLGRLLGRLHRPRRPPLGGRPQSQLDSARGRPDNTPPGLGSAGVHVPATGATEPCLSGPQVRNVEAAADGDSITGVRPFAGHRWSPWGRHLRPDVPGRCPG